MPKFNDIDLKNWKQETVLTDSLWLFNERAKYGKHEGSYHGNFIPQIPHQLIRRYTKENDAVLDCFLGSGTTAFECEELNRNCIGIDIQEELIEKVKNKLNKDTENHFSYVFTADSTQESTYTKIVNDILLQHNKQNVQLVILHPPYSDIIKFSDKEKDLSNCKTLKEFIDNFTKVVNGVKNVLEKDRYLAIVIGDKYTDGVLIPLGFYCMYATQKLGLTLKATIVKNIEGNRDKLNKQAIWRYRALSSDYYIFKHEYIFIFKNK
ncbi:MAG: site-specific DNA-methyltransferase [Bacteroidales bacterium]|jgi:DNA modification methylase|nr:site-specific DNA-methyltransferase [Bacteroidales bacterium]